MALFFNTDPEIEVPSVTFDAGIHRHQKDFTVDPYTPEMLEAITTATKNRTTVPDGVIKPIEFPTPEARPAFSANGSQKDNAKAQHIAQVLNGLINLVEHHSHGTYDDVLKTFHLNGKGVSEALPLLSSPHRARLAGRGNVYEQVDRMLRGQEDNTLPEGHKSGPRAPFSMADVKMVYTALISVDKNTHESDENVAKEAHPDGYDHKDTVETLKPFTKHYKSFKVDLSSAKQMLVPGYKYPLGGKQIGKSNRLRPETKDPLLVGKWMALHAGFAISLDALQDKVLDALKTTLTDKDTLSQLEKFKQQRQVSESKFAREKKEARLKVLEYSENEARGIENDKPKPEYYPTIDARAALEEIGIKFGEDIRACPVLTGMSVEGGNFNETEAAAAFNLKTNEWFTLQNNNSAVEDQTLTARTFDGPPIFKNPPHPVRISSDVNKAAADFNNGVPSRSWTAQLISKLPLFSS